eukprot:TRINITY_DN1351_c0_g1_i1.p2 TRINITY_DN1351_c0_g1~~TRINITY_DN1351_c0_g1_i1.p2  ORF type:complete len:126 (-),score=23.02 TRINITY_DN1351_c0_g1_i1:254-631(-)
MKVIVLLMIFVSTTSGMLTGGRELIDLDMADDTTMSSINETALFAVDEINALTEEDMQEFSISPVVPLTLIEVESAEQQVVQGILYHLLIETEDANGDEDFYYVQVQSTPWLDDALTLVSVENSD